MYFSAIPAISDEQKIAKFISLLTGKALQWASAFWRSGSEHTTSYDNFLEGIEVSENLLTIKQGSRRVADYALDFHTLAAASRWNELALKAFFRQGLRPEVLSELAN